MDGTDSFRIKPYQMLPALRESTGRTVARNGSSGTTPLPEKIPGQTRRETGLRRAEFQPVGLVGFLYILIFELSEWRSYANDLKPMV